MVGSIMYFMYLFRINKIIVPEVDASLTKRRKMKRRNAFVNVFGKSGQPNNTVFDHFREIEKIRLGVPADSSNRQHSVESEEAEYEETRLAEEEIDKHSSTHDFETEKETDQSVHTNNSLNDQRKWNQTKLQFSPARSGCQKQEIEALECMRENASPSKQDRTGVSVYNNQEPRVASKMKKTFKTVIIFINGKAERICSSCYLRNKCQSFLGTVRIGR